MELVRIQAPGKESGNAVERAVEVRRLMPMENSIAENNEPGIFPVVISGELLFTKLYLEGHAPFRYHTPFERTRSI